MKSRLIFISIIAGIAVVILILFRPSSEQEKQPLIYEPDLSDHPVYNKYVFGQDETIIDFGIQPLWIPTSIIAEVMKRDHILKDELRERGLEIRFHPFFKGADVNFFLNRGDLETGIGGDMPALTAVVASDVLVASLIQKGFCAIVAKKHMLLSELRGKRIAYAFGSNAHYALLQSISNAGLSETEIQMIPMDVNEMPKALDEGRIDAFSAWEPTPTIATTMFEDQVVIHRIQTTGYLYFTPSFVQKHPQVVNHILASQVRAIRWLQQNRKNLLRASQWALDSGEDLSGASLGLNSEQVANLANKDLIGITTTPIISKRDLSRDGSLYREFEFLKDLGRITVTIPWDNVVDNFDKKVLLNLLKHPKRYSLNKFNVKDTYDE